jgi:hypothetical protein
MVTDLASLRGFVPLTPASQILAYARFTSFETGSVPLETSMARSSYQQARGLLHSD